jgi:hypothetical protein
MLLYVEYCEVISLGEGLEYQPSWYRSILNRDTTDVESTYQELEISQLPKQKLIYRGKRWTMRRQYYQPPGIYNRENKLCQWWWLLVENVILSPFSSALCYLKSLQRAGVAVRRHVKSRLGELQQQPSWVQQEASPQVIYNHLRIPRPKKKFWIANQKSAEKAAWPVCKWRCKSRSRPKQKTLKLAGPKCEIWLHKS